MFRVCRLVCSPGMHDPFRVLGLPRTCSKVDIKQRYRELARAFHPDSESGDSAKMERVNQAYKILMKEGGYERLHLATSTSRPRTNGRNTFDNQASSQPVSPSPFSADHQTVEHEMDTEAKATGWTPSGGSASCAWGTQSLCDEDAERLGALDVSTERRTPKGTFMYQSRDDLSWVELNAPLYGSQHTRYSSFGHMADLEQELRRRSMEAERVKNERSAFDRVVNRLANSGDLPTYNKRFLRFYACLLCFLFYLTWKRGVARKEHHRQRTQFYHDIDRDREAILSSYARTKDEVECMVVSAAAILLAASAHKNSEDGVPESGQEKYYSTVRPPPEHFNVHAGF